MEEERRSIEGYEEIYDITRSGRIINKDTGHVKSRNDDEHGYTYVHLYKSGGRKLFKTFDLWKKAFPEVNPSEYKGK